MLIDQISVFVENKAGRLAAVMEILNKNGIDIRAMTVADTADFGILRIIVNDTEKAIAALQPPLQRLSRLLSPMYRARFIMLSAKSTTAA